MDGKVVLITGASRGIGRATALAMAEAGANVAIAARTERELQSLAGEIETSTGRRALVCVTDVGVEAEIERMVADTMAALGRVDVLVNNAGFNTRKAKIWEMTTAEWDRMFAVNLRGAFLCCRAVLPSMIELGLTKSLIKEARPYGIRVTAFSPGGTDTSFRAEPRPQYLTPETVAEGIVWCASLPERAVVHDLVMRPIVETNF
jgi:NAD(P)-dependent dehydrogenase (short-subunit alcohol dehydrogenase family)